MNELLELVDKTIRFYFANNKIPTEAELSVRNQDLLAKKGCIFVTIYKDGAIRGSAGNVKELEANLVMETAKAAIDAITKDTRFKPMAPSEATGLKYRVDYIKERAVIQKAQVKNLNPQTSGVIVIALDGSKMAVILPGISSKLVMGEDLVTILNEKLQTNFEQLECYVYEIKTDNFTNLV